MKRWSSWAAAGLCAAALSACVTVQIRPRDVTLTNDDVARQGLKLSGRPTAQGDVGSGRRVTSGSLTTTFGKLHYVFVDGRPDKPLILFCGGNGFREAYAGAARAHALAPFGDAILFDYPGSGHSDGKGVRGEYEVAVAALATEIEARAGGANGRPVIFWGHSLGGGVCSAVAARAKVRASLVLEGAFASYGDVAKAKAGLLAPFVRVRTSADTLDYDIPGELAHFAGAVVVVASRADETIPFGATRRLAGRLRGEGLAVTFVELSKAKHSTLFTDPEYAPAVTAALATAHASASR